MSQSRPKRPKKNDTQLEIQARPCTIYVSTSIDAYFENKRHLIPWNGEDSRMIDRYDARNLLQSITQWKNPHTPKKQLLSSEERELDKERYSDLFHKPTEEEEDDDEDQEEESISPIRKTAASKSSSSGMVQTSVIVSSCFCLFLPAYSSQDSVLLFMPLANAVSPRGSCVFLLFLSSPIPIGFGLEIEIIKIIPFLTSYLPFPLATIL